MSGNSIVGQPIVRVDGRAKITGAARYAADFSPARVADAVLVVSTISRGRIAAIDAAAARKAAGVLAVLTHENAPKLHMPSSEGGVRGQSVSMGEKRLPLADGDIQYAGDIVAIVVAETLDEARYAASLVRVTYAEQTPTLDYRAAESTATAPGAALGGRPAQHSRGDVAAALGAPGVVKVEATYTIPVETNNPMEMSATVAEWQGDRLTVHDATQGVMGSRDFLSKCFGIPAGNVRVICPYVGGGFGCKGHQWPHTLAAAMAARAVGRPVRLMLTRDQMFTGVGHRPPTTHRLALAASSEGKLTAIRHETVNATSPLTEFVAPCGVVTSRLLYACENVDTPTKVVKVNVGAPTPMRAPAECPGSFAIESAMDELAAALKIDPLQLRLLNYAEKDPATGKPWSSKHLDECYAKGAEKFGWSRRDPTPGAMKDGELLVGWGMATANYPGVRWPCAARVRLTDDGRAVVQAATQELGTGSYTVFTQVAADALEMPPERITFELGDTELPAAPLSAGSCSAASVSEAVIQAAKNARANLAAAASAQPDQLGTLAPDRLAALLKTAGKRSIEGEASVKLEDEKTKAYTIQSFGAHFCEIKIDPLLPRVQVTRFVSVFDVGKILNQRTATSQMAGGIVMGLGMALMEETAYDPRTGRPVTDNFADYAIPVNADVPPIEVELLDHPDPVINTLGCRGGGEIGIVGVAAAVANAVYHATGKRIRELPITIDKLL